MKIATIATISVLGALLSAGSISGQALAANFGTVTLVAGQTQAIDLGPTGRNMRVCNDRSSAGPVLVTIGGNAPHDLSPGLCAEEMGDRLLIHSEASGLSTVDFKSICDGSAMN